MPGPISPIDVLFLVYPGVSLLDLIVPMKRFRGGAASVQSGGTSVRCLGRNYEDITVDADAIFVRDGRIWTSAGVTTGIDLTLALAEEDFGRDLAMFVARLLVVYLRRTGGSHNKCAACAQTSSATDRFTDLERWMLENP